MGEAAQDLISVDELAKCWSVSTRLIKRLVKKSELVGIKQGRQTMIDVASTHAYLAAHIYQPKNPEYPPPPPSFDPRKPVVYFVRAANGPVKIGTAECFEPRFKSLCAMSPVKLELIALFNGGRTEERALHKKFAAYRLHSEWFRPMKKLLKLAAFMGIRR